MKSLLVDALRQAEEQSADDAGTEAGAAEPAADETSTASETFDTGSDAIELSLADSVFLSTESIEVGQQGDAAAALLPPAADSAAHPATADAEDDSAEDEDQQPDAMLTETGIFPAESLAPAPTAVNVDTPAAIMPLIGRYSPLLAVAAATIAAINILAYDRFGAGGEKLGLLTSPAAHGGDAAVHPQSGLEAGGSPFILYDAAPSPVRPASPIPDAVGTAPAQQPVTGRGRATIETRGQRAPLVRRSSAVDDPAFGVVSAAYAAYSAGDLELAEKHYREALEIAARHPNALHGLGAILEQTGRTREAQDIYATLLSVEPDNAAAAAALLAAAEGAADVIAEIKLMIQQYPHSAPLHAALGARYAAESRWPEAVRAYAGATAADPGNGAYAYNYAVGLERIGRAADAARQYARALELAHSTPVVDRSLIEQRLLMLEVNKDTSR